MAIKSSHSWIIKLMTAAMHCHMAACKLEDVDNINNLTFTNLKFDLMLFRYLSIMDVVLFLWMIVIGVAHGDNTYTGNIYSKV